MCMCLVRSTENMREENGSALVLAIIVLVILSLLGVVGLDVADMNTKIAANDRDAKDAFFQADAGVNMGHEYLEISIDAVNSTFYGSDAQIWNNETVAGFSTANFPLQFYISGSSGTYIRSGMLGSGEMEGAAIQMSAGYEGVGKGAAHGGSYTLFLIRSHREGRLNSRAEVDLGWRHVNY